MRTIQLKPSEVSLMEFIYAGRKHFDAFVLCEGYTDAEVIKRVALKLNRFGEEQEKRIAVTNAEVLENLHTLATTIISLLRFFRKVKVLALVADANKMRIEDRVRSLVDSLRSHGLEANYTQIKHQLYEITPRFQPNKIRIYIAINGIEEYDFEKHELEDHIVKLLELRKDIERIQIERADSAKELLAVAGFSDIQDILKIIDNSKPEEIKDALKHITNLIRLVIKDP